jgi:hypothetical protein
VLGPVVRIAGLSYLAYAAWGATPTPALPTFIYTETSRYERRGSDRFPAGAALRIVTDGSRRPLIPAFAASADAAVSFDAKRVLFAGKRNPSDRWQIWELTLNGGAPRRITNVADDCVTPFYLPDGRIVYSRGAARGFQLEIAPLARGPAERLTYAPGDHIVSDVLLDGRILYEAPYPDGLRTGGPRDLYTVRADGSGVQTYRCDHRGDRRTGRQISSGDIVFETAGQFTRFPSSRAVALAIDTGLPAGDFAGPVAELASGQWLVSYRPNTVSPFALCLLQPGASAPEPVLPAAKLNAVQPVFVRARAVPKREPSSLGNHDGANVLCVNAYHSREPIRAGSIARVRVWVQDDAGAPVTLGQAPVAGNGSFYLNIPSERPIRFELLDRNGNGIAAERGWFWLRRGEDRACEGCHTGSDTDIHTTRARPIQPIQLLLPNPAKP